MSFFRSLFSDNVPEELKTKDELKVIQEQTLQTLYFIMMGAGLIAIVIVMTTSQTISALLSLALYGGFVLVGFRRQMPFFVRTLVLLFSFYALAFWFFGSSIGWIIGYTLLIPPALVALVLLGINHSLFYSMLGFIILLFLTSYPYNTHQFSKVALLGAYIFANSTLILFLSNFMHNLQFSLSEQQKLSRTIDYERRGLEKKVEQRTVDLQRRINQIRTAVGITRSITSILNLQELLQVVVNLLIEQMDLYYVGIFFVDSQSKYAILRAGSGEAGRNMISEGHRLEVGGSSMIGWTIAHREARIALDVGNEAVRFNNPHLPLTRSELAIPIISRDAIFGAISIQSTSPNAFDNDDILLFKGVADSLATAIRNAQLFEQNQKDIEEIRSLNRQFLKDSWKNAIDVYGTLSYTHENPDVLQVKNSSGVVQIPINLREQIIGQITVETPNPSLTPQEMATVETIVTQTALALENARLIEESQRHAAQEAKVNLLSAEFSKAINVEGILKTAIKEIGRLPGVTEASVHLLPPDLFDPSDSQPNTPKNGHGQENFK